MPVERSAWPDTFTEESAPRWPCPYCRHTICLAADGISFRETGPSRARHGHEAWEPEWLDGRFVATYACSGCGDPAVVHGSYFLEEEPDPTFTQREYHNRYRIMGIEPAPALVHLPAQLPEAVRSELDRAFRLFWVDGAACANAIRGVVEVFLNEKGVRKTSGSRKRRDRLSLHARIEEFKKKDDHLGTALMAVKWIGNVGSHSEQPGRDRLLDGFELLEHVLEEAYAPAKERASRLARDVNRRRGR